MNFKEYWKMGNNSVKNHFYGKLKKGYLDRYIRNVIYQFQNSAGYK